MGEGFEFWEKQLLSKTKYKIHFLGDAFKHVFDVEADFGRLGRLARTYRPIVVLRAIRDVAGYDIKGDPYAYLAQVMRNKAEDKPPDLAYQDHIMAEDMLNMERTCRMPGSKI